MRCTAEKLEAVAFFSASFAMRASYARIVPSRAPYHSRTNEEGQLNHQIRAYMRQFLPSYFEFLQVLST